MVQQNSIGTASGYGSYYFGTVRVMNNFIADVNKCVVSDELKIRMKAETRFFRALGYSDLITKFGKVPVITDALVYDAPNVKRDEVETVRKFILDELVEIAEILPDSYNGSYMYETGRITRVGTLALRARVALHFGNYAEVESSARKIVSEGHHSPFRVLSLTATR